MPTVATGISIDSVKKSTAHWIFVLAFLNVIFTLYIMYQIQDISSYILYISQSILLPWFASVSVQAGEPESLRSVANTQMVLSVLVVVSVLSYVCFYYSFTDMCEQCFCHQCYGIEIADECAVQMLNSSVTLRREQCEMLPEWDAVIPINIILAFLGIIGIHTARQMHYYSQILGQKILVASPVDSVPSYIFV